MVMDSPMTMEIIVNILAERYVAVRGGPDETDELIEKMAKTLIENVYKWPLDKTNRWIGFMQGVLYAEGLIDIDEERDFSRPLFHQYYEDNGINIPESVEI